MSDLHGFLPSGSCPLDAALGGGYPLGRIVEIYGPEGVGKRRMAHQAIAAAQSDGHTVAYLDASADFDPAAARADGVALDRLLLSQPDCAEQAIHTVDTLIRSGSVALIVLHGRLAPLHPDAEDPNGSRLMSRALRKLTASAHRFGATVLFVNDLRQRIGVTFGNRRGYPGENALKFYASVRIGVRRAFDERSAAYVRARVVKNKVAPPFREAAIYFERDLHHET